MLCSRHVCSATYSRYEPGPLPLSPICVREVASQLHQQELRRAILAICRGCASQCACNSAVRHEVQYLLMLSLCPSLERLQHGGSLYTLMCCILRERLQKMRRRTSTGLAHTSSHQQGNSSDSAGGGGGTMWPPPAFTGCACAIPAFMDANQVACAQNTVQAHRSTSLS